MQILFDNIRKFHKVNIWKQFVLHFSYSSFFRHREDFERKWISQYLSIPPVKRRVFLPSSGIYNFSTIKYMNKPGIHIISGEVRTITTGNHVTIADANNNLQTVHMNMGHMIQWVRIWVHAVIEMTKSGPKSIVTYSSRILDIIHDTHRENAETIVYGANHSLIEDSATSPNRSIPA